ncbi:hypothetical protein AAVH_33321, partial [Aphelenchoides avenae]
FFRRAVAGRRNYRCKALSSCRREGFQDFRTFPACKCCRFRRCIKVGMKISGVAFSVPELVSSTSSESTYLQRYAAYRNTLFLRRIRFITEDGHLPRRFESTTKALGDRITRAELKVLKEYFSSFEDIWRFLRSDTTRDALTAHYFAAYALLEIVLTTSRNLGYRRNAIFTTVETCHSTMADAIAKDYNAWYFGSNINTIARQAADMWTCALSVAERIHQSFLDDLETTALTRLLFAQYESEFLEGEAGCAAFVNSIHSDLWCHYEQISADCTTSFDRLASILVHFNELWYKFCQVMVIIDLHVPKKPQNQKSAPLQACQNADGAAAIPGDVTVKIDSILDDACSDPWPVEYTAD